MQGVQDGQSMQIVHVCVCSTSSVFCTGHSGHADCSQGQSMSWTLLCVRVCVHAPCPSLSEWHVLIRPNLISLQYVGQTGSALSCPAYSVEAALG